MMNLLVLLFQALKIIYKCR